MEKQGEMYVNLSSFSEDVQARIQNTFFRVFSQYSILTDYITSITSLEELIQMYQKFEHSHLSFSFEKEVAAMRIVRKNFEKQILFLGIGISSHIGVLDLYDSKKWKSLGIAPHTLSIEGQVIHELGHVLDDVLELSGSEDFLNFCLLHHITPEVIAKEVSLYAATCPQEFIAEVFAEYQSGFANSFVTFVMQYIQIVYHKKELLLRKRK